MLASKDSPLVPSRGPAGTKPASVELLAVRAFCVGGQRIEPGTRRVFDARFAVELISANKAIRAPAAPPEPIKTAAKAKE
jgi:hypothetical protein